MSMLQHYGNCLKLTFCQGGVITHEYKLIKGFAAKASAKALETLNALATEFQPYIEEDQIVAVDGDIVEGGHL